MASSPGRRRHRRPDDPRGWAPQRERAALLVTVLLGLGRCVGATMAVLMATGHSARLPGGPLDPVGTLTATIAAELGEAARGGEHYRALFAVGLLLFVITFVVDLAADRMIRRRRAGA